MSEEARKAAHEHWWQEPVYPNTKCRCGLKWSDRDAHADHTAAIREKAEALVAKLETTCSECGCESEYHGSDPDDPVADGWCENCVHGCLGFQLSEELTALKDELEKGNG